MINSQRYMVLNPKDGNTYHARPGADGPRSTGIRRVHFDVDGCPMLDVTEDRDMTDELRKVETTIILV